MTKMETLETLCRAIDGASVRLTVARSYHDGTQPLSYLSPDARDKIGGRLSSLGVGYPALCTNSVAERLRVTGFTRDGQSLSRVWQAWQAAAGHSGLSDAIQEALTVGQSFLTVWTDDKGKPSVSVESPSEMAVNRDPVSKIITSAVKRWRGSDGKARAVLYEADAVTTFTGPEVPVGGVMPNVGWSHSHAVANPLGMCPVVDITNSDGMFSAEGVPESRNIWELTDALNKLLADSMIASESTALPRRWATGVQLSFDDDDNLIPPFNTQDSGAVWLSEKDSAKMGQFPEASLSSYGSHVELLVRQIGAVSGLPDHLIGISGTDPSSAEQIRASESSLVSRAYKKQMRFSAAIARAAALIEAIISSGPVRDDVEVTWKSPENRTRAAEADAVSKLYAAGILPWESCLKELGYSPSDIASMRRERIRASVEVPA